MCVNKLPTKWLGSPHAGPNGDYGKKSFMHYLLYLWLTVTIVVRLVVVVVYVLLSSFRAVMFVSQARLEVH